MNNPYFRYDLYVRNIEKGRLGEKIASLYLEKLGYKLLDKNWNCRWGELDLICRYNEEIIFVEVKYRSSDLFGPAEKSLGYRKIKNLYRTASYYLRNNNIENVNWRIEAITITKKERKTQVRHYKSLVS